MPESCPPIEHGLPLDERDTYDKKTIHLTAPPVTPTRPALRREYDVVVIGGGTAGLVASGGAALLGARTALIERSLLGGDCLLTGCVPSKAYIHAAALAHARKGSASWGVYGETSIRFDEVLRKVREIRSEVAHDDSVETVQGRGVDVLHGAARFTGRRELTVRDEVIRFKRAIICTGGRPRMPEIPGLKEVQPLTNETFFRLNQAPKRLLILGGGPIGCELAQASSRLGIEVVLVQRGARIMPVEDPEASEIVASQMEQDGVKILLNANATRFRTKSAGEELPYTAEIERSEGMVEMNFDKVLVAVGRLPNVENLGLELAGIDTDKSGIVVNKWARTKNRRIYAVGDVASRFKFTHAAFAQAEFAIQNALLPVRRNVQARVMSWCTFTDPEVAHVGPSSRELAQRQQSLRVLTVPITASDRAQVEGEERGFARVHLHPGSSRIVAATVVGRQAGELIVPLAMALTGEKTLAEIGETIHPYPTRSWLVRQLAYKDKASKVTPGVRRWLRRWIAWLS